jgi:hypothetical protein
MGGGRFQRGRGGGGSTVLKADDTVKSADDTAKSGAAAGEAKGGG